jgi:uncharacterized protein (DUF4415 family)
MARRKGIVRYSSEELAAMRARGESRTDWARAAAMTEAELEASIAADPDEAGAITDWSRATIVMPEPKAVLNMRIDRDVLTFYKGMGRGYQTRINSVLRAFMDSQSRSR